MNKSLAAAIAPLALVSFALPTQAGTATYGYDFTAAAEGNIFFSGTFSYKGNAVTNQGTETIGVEDGLTVTILFLGEVYDVTADADYPNFPRLILQDGEVQQLDFWMESSPRVNWWTLPEWNVEIVNSWLYTTLCATKCD